MRCCNPMTSAPAPRESAVKLCTAPRRARRQSHRELAGTISRRPPYSAEARRCRSATKSVLFFWTVQICAAVGGFAAYAMRHTPLRVRRRFLFRQDRKEQWGVHLPSHQHGYFPTQTGGPRAMPCLTSKTPAPRRPCRASRRSGRTAGPCPSGPPGAGGWPRR